MLGHELRNPLGAISSAIHALERVGSQTEQAGRLRGIIARQAGRLARLVDDLLDVARVTSGKIGLERQPVDLQEIAARCLTALHQAGRTGEHQIVFTGDSTLVDADPTRLEQVVANLLDNALKYTPAGGRIQIVVEREKEEAVLRAKDTGAGIPPEALPRLFDLFVQGAQSGCPAVYGYSVARAARSAAGGERLFLVALTGYGQPEDRRRAEQAGFDAHLVKPIDEQHLLGVLATQPRSPDSPRRPP